MWSLLRFTLVFFYSFSTIGSLGSTEVIRVQLDYCCVIVAYPKYLNIDLR